MKTKKERFPVYQTIKTEMREWIQTGIWKLGDLIPAEAALTKRFSCDRATVHRALRELVQEGMLECRGKAGTRVVMPVGRSANFEILQIFLEI